MGFGGALFALSAVQAVSQISQGYAQNNEAKLNASAIEDTGRYNSALLMGKANQIDMQSDIEQGQYTRLKGQYASKSAVAVAGQGIAPQGSALAVMINAQTQIGIDQAIAKYNSTNESNYTRAGAAEQTRSAGLQADQYRRGGKLAVRGGYTGAFSSLLQGATSYAMYKMPAAKSTTFDFSTKIPSNTAPYRTPNMSSFR